MKIPFLFVFLLSVALPGFLRAETIQIDGSNVTFESPDGFTALSDDEISAKFPSENAPKFAIGNKNRTTIVAYDIKPHAIPTDKLDEVKESFVKLFSLIIPGIEWKEQKLIDLAGRKWIYLEMTSNTTGTNIHNIMLITAYEEKMLVFNFNSTKQDFPELEPALRKSLESIKIGNLPGAKTTFIRGVRPRIPS
jgi:hypothetical protein